MRHLGVAGRRQADALARQPLQRAVLAQVQDGVGAENIADPAIVGDVMVGRRQVRAVVNGDGIFPKAPRGLQPHENVAQIDACDGQRIGKGAAS